MMQENHNVLTEDANNLIWDMLEKHSESSLSDAEKDMLILNLLKSHEQLRATLKWYGDENHIVSTWYSRKNTELCNMVENSSNWKFMHTEDRDYVENGSRAEVAASDSELPLGIIETLMGKANPSS